MTALRHYPSCLIGGAKLQWEIAGMVVGGGQTGSGVMPVTRLDGGGLWKATLSEVVLRTTNHRRTWRALSAIAEGGVQPIIVPVSEIVDAPWPVVAGETIMSFDQVPHSDDALFSDDSGYQSGVIEAVGVGAVALRATSMTMEIIAGGDLGGGEYFAIDHADLRWRLYRIRTAIDNGDGTWDVTFRPPLRAAIEDGVHIEFDQPKCVMRLASSDSMDAVLSRPVFYGRVSVSFIEAFPPFPE